MTSIDSSLVDFTEWLCRRIQVLTGRTNIWLAFQLTNLSIVVYFGWVMVLYWLSGLLALRIFVALFCAGVFLVLTRTIFKVSIEASELQAYQRVKKGLRNPRRLRDVQLRVSFLTLSVLLPALLGAAYTVQSAVRFMAMTEALAVLTTAVLYVLACDPLPPCAGTVTEWVRSLMPARAVGSRT